LNHLHFCYLLSDGLGFGLDNHLDLISLFLFACNGDQQFGHFFLFRLELGLHFLELLFETSDGRVRLLKFLYPRGHGGLLLTQLLPLLLQHAQVQID